MLEKGISVNVTTCDNETPFSWACQEENNVDNVTFLLDYGADISTLNKSSSVGALHYAAKRSDKTVVEFLLKKGISANVKDNDNKTPLLWGCQNKKTIENATLLLKYSAEINVINKEHGACALHYAAKHSDKEMIQFLLERGVDVNVASSDSETPLLWACQQKVT